MVARKEKPSNKVTNEPSGEAEREEDEMKEEIALAGTVEADCLSGLSEDGPMAGDQPLPTLTEGLGEVWELTRLQEEDDSLSEWRRKGVEQEEGFMLDGNATDKVYYPREGSAQGSGPNFQKKRNLGSGPQESGRGALLP